jgi:putative tricarboxylic transport membrane protein
MSDLVSGLLSAASPVNLLYCLLGCLAGTLTGVLPGFGPTSATALLFPLAFYLPPDQSLILLAGIYYGAQYGGSTTAILLNVPGEVSSVPTALDGYQMTLKGKAGAALSIAALTSFGAGTLAMVGLTVFGPAIARLGLMFGPAERLGLFVFAMTCAAALSGNYPMRGLVCTLVGMLLATVGVDPLAGVGRLTFGRSWLLQGLDLVPLVMGVFGVSEVVATMEEKTPVIALGRIGSLLPSRSELKTGMAAGFRGTLVGFGLGLIPGMMPAITSFIAYDVERKLSSHPSEFGRGAIEGVASPEAANNATVTAGFIPLLSLGIPTSPTLALLMAALIVYGITPGPLMFTLHANLAWTIIGSMYIGNVILLILNLPLVGLWARLALIPYRLLGPIILGLCMVGSYCIRNSMFDVWSCLLFGAIGWWMRRRSWPAGPLVLGFILGSPLEESARQVVELSRGEPGYVLGHPIALAFFALAVGSLYLSLRLLGSAEQKGAPAGDGGGV